MIYMAFALGSVRRVAGRDVVGKSRFISLVLLLSLSLLVSACSAGGDGGAPQSDDGPSDENAPGKFDENSTMAAIQKRGKILIGIQSDVPPFSATDPNTGTLQGFDVEIAKLLAKGIFGAQLEGKIEWVQLDPRDRELALEQKRVDMAMGRYSITIARKRFVDFAGPYYIGHQVLIYDSERFSNTTGIQDFNQEGTKLCTVRGSTLLDVVKATLPGADSSLLLNSVAECTSQLLGGRVAGIVANRADVADLIGQSSRRLEIAGEEFGPEPYGIGINKAADDFRQYINDRLENQIADQWGEIYEATMHAGEEARQPKPDRY